MSLLPMSRLACAAALALSLMPCAQAQTASGPFPNRPIRFVIGFPAGGSTDVIARSLTQPMTTLLKQQIIVDNKPGADSLIGTRLVAQADPDGYTLLVASGSHTINASLYPDSKVDPVKDFEPVILIGDATNYLVVHPSVKASTVEELIALAKANPGKLNYASGASTTFLATELFSAMAGIKMQHVSYKGAGQSVPAILGGEVEVIITSLVTMNPHVKAGRVRALAVTGAKRSALAPDMPTVAEKAVPGYTATTWYGVFAPAGTPAAVIALLNQTFRTVMQDAKVRETLDSQGVENSIDSPEDFRKFVIEDLAKWARVVADSGAAKK